MTEKRDLGGGQGPTKYLICRNEKKKGGESLPEKAGKKERRMPETVAVISPEDLDDLMKRIHAVVAHEIEYAIIHKTRKATDGETRAAEEHCRQDDDGDDFEMIFQCR